MQRKMKNLLCKTFYRLIDERVSFSMSLTIDANMIGEYLLLSERYFAVIIVAPKIEYDAQYKQPVALNAGATLTLPIKVSGVPTPKVSWYFGDKELKPGNGTTIETKEQTSKLTIKNTTGANAGAYQVKAENAAGSDKAEFKVTMKGKNICNQIYFGLSCPNFIVWHACGRTRHGGPSSYLFKPP